MRTVRLINGDALRRKVKRESNQYGKPSIDFESGKRVIELIDSQPTVQLEIIRCKDCKQFRRWIDTDICFCDITEAEMSDNDFCSRAVRREDE